MRCKHDWKVLVDKVIPSQAEEFVTKFPDITKLKGANAGRVVVIILTCTKCGKLDKTVKYNV